MPVRRVWVLGVVRQLCFVGDGRIIRKDRFLHLKRLGATKPHIDLLVGPLINVHESEGDVSRTEITMHNTTLMQRRQARERPESDLLRYVRTDLLMSVA